MLNVTGFWSGIIKIVTLNIVKLLFYIIIKQDSRQILKPGHGEGVLLKVKDF
jgi:hypothetical protein